MGQPKLLFLSHRLPFPPHNGAAIRTFNILRLLARHYEITALCFDRIEPATSLVPLETRLAGLSGLGRFQVFRIPQQFSKTRLVWDHVRSISTRRAYTYFTHDSPAFRRAIGHAMAEAQFDLIHVDSLDLVQFMEGLPLDRVVLTHHNTESALLARRSAAESSAIRRRYLQLQSRLLRKEEARWVPQVALNVVVSREDELAFREIAPTANFGVVPNGVDVDFFRPNQQAVGEGLVFVGGTGYFPNLDALRWFTSSVLPELRSRGCQAEVTFVGRARPEEIEYYGRIKGLRLTGYVEDIRPLVQAAGCFIAPIRVGGGTRLKLVDAWAMGKAIVATTIGAEGLDAKDNINILLRDTPAAFADAIVEVLGQPVLRRQLELAARQTAEDVYSWDVIEREMIGKYERVRCDASKSAPPLDFG